MGGIDGLIRAAPARQGESAAATCERDAVVERRLRVLGGLLLAPSSAARGTSSSPATAFARAAVMRYMWLEDAGNDSVDRLDTESLGFLDVVLHRLERFGGVPLPIGELARDPQRLPGAV